MGNENFQLSAVDSFLSLKDGEIYRSVINDTERMLIEKVLQRTSGNQFWAARVLGLNRNTLRSKIKKLNIPMEKFKT